MNIQKKIFSWWLNKQPVSFISLLNLNIKSLRYFRIWGKFYQQLSQEWDQYPWLWHGASSAVTTGLTEVRNTLHFISSYSRHTNPLSVPDLPPKSWMFLFKTGVAWQFSAGKIVLGLYLFMLSEIIWILPIWNKQL